MKLPTFEYETPATIDEAVGLLAEHGDEAKVLAGGQSLIPLLAMRLARPAVLIDINNVAGLSDISVNGEVTIGAMARHRAVERSEAVHSVVPILAAALHHVGHDAIRTRGTIGGSIAHADPSAELPTLARTLGATMVVTNAGGSREIEADDFFQGFLMTSLEPDELLTAVKIPIGGAGSGWSFNEVARRDGDFALVGCAVTLQLGADATITGVRIGLLGVSGEPFRAATAEAALLGASAGDAAFAEAAQAAADEVTPTADLHGTSAYRRHLTGVLVRRGLNESFATAEGNK
jgi:aerobic carbon-monoxide dehydrogenase medium subunit